VNFRALRILEFFVIWSPN